jgi:hypothetical protein
VNDAPPGPGQEYQDVAVAPDGRVLIVWLDERGAPEGSPNEKQVSYAVSVDGGRTFGPNLRLTSTRGGVCPCCRPTAAASPGGAFHVAYRDRKGDDLLARVATLATGAGAFRPPVAVSGPWGFDACPVDAPSLAAGPGRSLRVAWMDGAMGEERVWEALSTDEGASFGTARQVAAAGTPADAVAGRAVLALHPRLGALAAWEDSMGQIRVRALDRPSPSILVAAPDGGSARSPSLAVLGDEVHVVWVEMVLEADAAPDAKLPERKLRHAVLRAEGGMLTMDRGGGGPARP